MSTGDGDLADEATAQAEAIIEMLHLWLAQADKTVDVLKQHLRGVLEICRQWEPDYASGMDRQTLMLAADAARDIDLPDRAAATQAYAVPAEMKSGGF